MKLKGLMISTLSLMVVTGIGGYCYTHINSYEMTKEPLYYIPKIGVVEKSDKPCYRMEQPITFADGKVTIEEIYYYDDLIYVDLQLKDHFIKDADEVVVGIDGYGVAYGSTGITAEDNGYICEITKQMYHARTEKSPKQAPKVSVIVGEYKEEVGLIPIDTNNGKNTSWSVKKIDDYQVSIIPVTPDYSQIGIMIEPKVQKAGVTKEVSVLSLLQESISAFDESGNKYKLIYDKNNEFRMTKLEGKRVGHYKIDKIPEKKIKQVHIEKIIEDTQFETGYEPSFDIPNPGDGEIIALNQILDVDHVSYKILSISRIGDVVTIDGQREEISEVVDGGVINFKIEGISSDRWEKSGDQMTIKGIPHNSQQGVITLKANGVTKVKTVDWHIKLR